MHNVHYWDQIYVFFLKFILTVICARYYRYLKNGPGNLEKDVERRFSYALSREDIENAILGGPWGC